MSASTNTTSAPTRAIRRVESGKPAPTCAIRRADNAHVGGDIAELDLDERDVALDERHVGAGVRNASGRNPGCRRRHRRCPGSTSRSSAPQSDLSTPTSPASAPRSPMARPTSGTAALSFRSSVSQPRRRGPTGVSRRRHAARLRASRPRRSILRASWDRGRAYPRQRHPCPSRLDATRTRREKRCTRVHPGAPLGEIGRRGD
jgi:hypothetical protein